jgi:hypothetical protein
MYYISIYLPRIGKTAKLKEFTNKQYFNLAKFYYNKDNNGIADFFNTSIYELLINKEIYGELTCIEKFIIWLSLYNNCLYDTISLFSKSVNDTVNIRVSDIIQKINEIDFAEEYLIDIDNMQITLNAPSSMYIESADEILESIIYSIRMDEKIYYFQNFNDEEKTKFISSLPGGLFESFINYYSDLNKSIHNILPQNDIITFDPIELTAANGTMFAFLRSIFNIELKTHYNNILVFMKQFQGNYDSYFSMTFKDFLALYTMYESSIKTDKNSLNIPGM